MALYQEFSFKSTGVQLTSMNDFVNASIGTQFEKNTGELYQKLSSGTFEKIARKYYSQSEADDRYLNITGDTGLSGSYIPATDNSINLGDATHRFANMYSTYFRGVSTTSLYADLAEKYVTDKEYEVGTVLEVGGEKEVTLYNGGALAGVVSGKPGLMLNDESEGQFVALKGKVPVFCEGDVKKGQYCIAVAGGKVKSKTSNDLVSSDLLKIVGVALEDSKDGMVVVKV